MASYAKQAPWASNRGQSQNQIYSYSQNTPVTYPLNYMQDHHSKSGSQKSRSFTGVVTKVLDNHGFIDKEIYFHVSACEKPYPKVGDTVMVDAVYNPNNPYKWTSTRVQVIEDRGKPYPKFDRPPHKRERSPLRAVIAADKRRRMDRPPREYTEKKERDREREQRLLKEREKLKEKDHDRQISPRRQRRSPIRSRGLLRYVVKIPTDLLTMCEYDAVSLKKRFNLYIPSDFFITSSVWTEAFQPERSFTLEKPCAFHIMHKECDSLTDNIAVHDPQDADYLYTAQVMLVSFPTMDEIYKKCITLTEDEDKNQERTVHINRLIHFLVRNRKNEPASIGGPWSPSLDGLNPDKDPSVLIKTAIRTFKALTGVDLSSCSQWYRFVEINYHRSESVQKGKVIPARIETVVYFLPEVWNCAPTQLEWDNLVSEYGKLLEVKINPPQDVKETTPSEDAKQAASSTTTTQNQNQTSQKDDLETDDKDGDLIVIDKCEPTHYSKLDPKNMKVNELRQELEARNISAKGLKSQLLARLLKALKTEEDEEHDDAKSDKKPEKDSEVDDSIVKEESKDAPEDEEEKEETQLMSESERATWVKRYTLPSTPHIIVHPSKTSKSGKFECNLVSLHSLLVYHSDFVKEDVFEVRLFAELFNDMLTRDFGYHIFKALYRAPEKPKEEKEKKDVEEKKDKSEKKDAKSENEEAEKSKKGEVKSDEITENETGENEGKEEMYITIDEDKTTDNKPESEEGELSKDDDASKDVEIAADKEAKPEEKEHVDKAEKEKEDVKKKKPLKMYTKDKYLLLSFSFFDQSSCGYIFEKDLESLFQSLGLYLSRSQIKKIINKVTVRDTVHYRKLTDRPKVEDGDEDIPAEKEDDIIENDIPIHITNNKKALQSVLEVDGVDLSKKVTRKSKTDTTQAKSQGGLLNYNGAFIDIENLLTSIKRSESSRLEMERVIQNLKNANETLQENVKLTSEKAKSTSSDLQTCRGKLMASNREIISLKGKMKTYVKVLTTIKDQVDPLLVEVVEKTTTEKVADQTIPTTETSNVVDDASKEKLQNGNVESAKPSDENPSAKSTESVVVDKPNEA